MPLQPADSNIMMETMSEQTHEVRRSLSPSGERRIVRTSSQRGGLKKTNSRRFSKRTTPRSNSRRRLVSADASDEPDIFHYAESKYVRTGTATSISTSMNSTTSLRSTGSTSSSHSLEEQDALMMPSSAAKERGDSLVTLSYADALNDVLNDVDDLDELSHDEAKNFCQFSETESKRRRKGYFCNALRRQFKKVRKGVKRTLRRPANMLTCCLVILGLIIVFASIGMSGGFKNNYSSKYIQHVPPSPAGLATTCEHPAANSRDTLAVPAMCQQSCNKAECCWNPNGNFECSADTEANCDAYVEPCSIMMKYEIDGGTHLPDVIGVTQPHLAEMTVFPPPSDLMDACKKDSNGNVGDYCKDQCAQADCCWNRKTQFSCTAETVHSCRLYKTVCSFLNEQAYEQVNRPPRESNGLPFPDAPIGMDYFCDPGKMGENLGVCKDKCNQAQCCWKDGVESCVDSVPNNACQAYTDACSFWNARDDNEQVVTSTSISASTSQFKGTTYAPTMSPQQQPEDQDDASPQPDEPSPMVDDTIPQAPDDLAANCALASLLTPDGKAECQRHCSKAECCWVPEDNDDGIESCYQDQMDVCDAYRPCSVLIGVGDNAGVSATAADSNPDNSDENTDTAADNSNTQAAEDVPTEDAPTEEETPEDTPADSGATQDTPAEAAPAPPAADTQTSQEAQDITRNCDSHFNRGQCINVCRPGVCCFDSSMQCNSSVDCSMYSACDVLFRRRLRPN